MTAIWSDDGAGWHLLAPAGFADEARSHTLVEERTVFERRAPNSIEAVEQLIAPATIGKGTSVRLISDNLLGALADAYKEAAGGKLNDSPASYPTGTDLGG